MVQKPTFWLVLIVTTPLFVSADCWGYPDLS